LQRETIIDIIDVYSYAQRDFSLAWMRGGNAMSNKREIEPSLDYFELRRRHEEYKNSQRQKDAPEAPSATLEEAVPQPAPIAEATSTQQKASAPLAKPSPVA
jgi:hypothetical protein